MSLIIEQMSIEDKLRAMEELWDDLCKRADYVPSPAWHYDLLQAREQTVTVGEASFEDWDVAKIRIREYAP